MSDQESELMLEALQMHLETIRSRLVSLTEHFQSQSDIPAILPPSPLPSPLAPTTEAAPDPPTAPPPPESRPQPVKRKGQLSRSDASSLTSAGPVSRSNERPPKPLSEQVAGWEPLHTYYEHLHLEALQRHVRAQVERRRRMDTKWQEACRRRERRERRARLEQKPRTFRSQLNHDNSFLERFHTSIFYKIVEVEHKMKRQGLLRSKVDHDTFWSTMLSGDRGKAPFPVQTHPVPAPVSPVREEEEELTNTWAITGLKETRPLSSVSPHVPATQKEDVISEIERAVELQKPPKIRSLSELIDSDSFRVEETSKVPNSAVLEVRSTRDRMETMLAHSRRHELEAQRFMERADFVDFSSLFSEFCADLEQLPFDCPSKVKKVPTTTQSPKSSPSLPPSPPLPPPLKETPLPLPPSSKPLGDITEESTPSITTANTANSDGSLPRAHEPVPLCLSEVVSCSLAVTRPTGRSTLWNPLLSID